MGEGIVDKSMDGVYVQRGKDRVVPFLNDMVLVGI
jgi:hypothetical protein